MFWAIKQLHCEKDSLLNSTYFDKNVSVYGVHRFTVKPQKKLIKAKFSVIINHRHRTLTALLENVLRITHSDA